MPSYAHVTNDQIDTLRHIFYNDFRNAWKLGHARVNKDKIDTFMDFFTAILDMLLLSLSFSPMVISLTHLSLSLLSFLTTLFSLTRPPPVIFFFYFFLSPYIVSIIFFSYSNLFPSHFKKNFLSSYLLSFSKLTFNLLFK